MRRRGKSRDRRGGEKKEIRQDLGGRGRGRQKREIGKEKMKRGEKKGLRRAESKAEWDEGGENEIKKE